MSEPAVRHLLTWGLSASPRRCPCELYGNCVKIMERLPSRQAFSSSLHADNHGRIVVNEQTAAHFSGLLAETSKQYLSARLSLETATFLIVAAQSCF